MAIVENEAVIHVQEHLGIYHYKSIFRLVSFLENAFEHDGNEEIKNCPKCKNFYAISLEYGTGLPVNKNKALELLTSAANQGYAKSQYNLATNYEDGRNVDVDMKKAYELCKAAADQNYPDALAGLPRIAKKYHSSMEIDKVEALLEES